MIAAIVLAAGRSTRMGRSKALLPVGDETFVARVVRVLREGGADEVVVVAGDAADAVSAAVLQRGESAQVVVNPRVDDGQLSSLIAGLDAVDRPGTEAVLVTPVDVPLLSPSTVSAVIACYRRTGAPVVRPVSGARHGHPVCIARALFDALRTADPTLGGAKPIVRARASREGDVEVHDEWAFRDVDTPSDYDALIAATQPPLE